MNNLYVKKDKGNKVVFEEAKLYEVTNLDNWDEEEIDFLANAFSRLSNERSNERELNSIKYKMREALSSFHYDIDGSVRMVNNLLEGLAKLGKKIRKETRGE